MVTTSTRLIHTKPPAPYERPGDGRHPGRGIDMSDPRTLHEPTTLYRLFASDGALLYVGIAGNPGRRFEQHRGTKPWWGQVAQTSLQHFKSRPEAMAAEMTAIRTERPRHNIMGASPSARPAVMRSSPAPTDPTQPYPIGTRWRWHNRRNRDRVQVDTLELFWELDGAPRTPDHADKGGFIQEATGWKPSPLQPFVNVETLAAACGLRSC